MSIHHSTLRKAEKLGVILTELKTDGGEFAIIEAFPNVVPPAGTVQAHWPKHNVYAFGAGEKPAQTALAEIEALVEIKEGAPEFVIVNKPDDPFLVYIFSDSAREGVHDRDGTTPRDALAVLKGEDFTFIPTTTPEDGGEAYRAGFLAGDNPFDEGSEEANQWDEEWDAAADEAESEDGESAGGSVVKSEYRIRYAEAGHPNHCGDWLANTLNNLVQGKSQTAIDRFEAICNENGVSLAKYNREKNGWQGRLRMTGRNLLAKVVYFNEGVLKLPHGMFPELGDSVKAPGDWMTAQKFKAKPAAPVNKEAGV